MEFSDGYKVATRTAAKQYTTPSLIDTECERLGRINNGTNRAFLKQACDVPQRLSLQAPRERRRINYAPLPVQFESDHGDLGASDIASQLEALTLAVAKLQQQLEPYDETEEEL